MMIRLLPVACAVLGFLASVQAQTPAAGTPAASTRAATSRPTELPVPLPADALQRHVLQHTLFLDNGSIRVGVCARVGRIVWFGPSKSNDNLLWLNTADTFARTRADQGWANWGGDKLWPAPQAQWIQVMGWRWPPDPVLDGLSWKVIERDDRSCTIESRSSPYWGIVMRRRITLDPARPRLEIRNTLHRQAASAWPVCSWPVTQALRPEYVLLGAAARRPGEAPWKWLNEPVPAEAADAIVRPLDGAVRFQPPPAPDTKIGTMGRWIAAVYGDWIFLQCADPIDPAGEYSDDASVQAYAAPTFVELELLGPVLALPTDQTLEHTVHWRLIQRAANQDVDGALQLISDALAEQ